MHLLAATPGSVDEGQEPVDLGQSPADVVFISAADTELAALSTARSEMTTPPGLRLASMMHLQHPMSVDLHIDACASKAKLVVARVLGGASYWKYGFEQYAARLADAGVAFAALPGDDKPDPDLRLFSTVSDQDYDALWAYLVEGGPKNSVNFLSYCQYMIAHAPKPQAAEPLLRAGVYWPGAGISDLSAAQTQWTQGAPIVPLIFYRALVQGAGLNPINRMTKALLQAGLNPLPIFVASLKDPISVATLDQLFQAAPPEVILNCTSFAVGNPHGDSSPNNPLTAASARQAPVLQAVLAASTEASWEEGLNGLSARDIAMNVALPEVDGRILSRAISFKGEAFFDAATECPIATYKARGDRVSFVAALAANWAQLRRAAPAQRQVALILANYPNKDGRLANGVGLDTPASAVHALALLQQAGYGAENAPVTSAELMAQIMAGPTNWLTDRATRTGGVLLPIADYIAHYQILPYGLRARLEERWGAPESDPFFDPKEGGFKLSILRFGNVTLGLQPARGYNIDPVETYHSPDLIPPHNYLAFYFWIRHHQKAQAIVHMGKHGNLEWLPGKALAMSDSCLPEGNFGTNAACLSLHRQRPRRGLPSQAACAGGDHRSPHPTPHPCGNLWPAARPRSFGR
jgi:cobaltochelatase CobN